MLKVAALSQEPAMVDAPAEFSGERAAKLVDRREIATADGLAKVAADEQHRDP